MSTRASVRCGLPPKLSQHETRSRLVAHKDASHTTPLTVLAELGVVGFVLYLALIGSAAVVLRRVMLSDRLIGIALAAIYFVLLVHSFVYSGFFEDPLTWGVLAFAAATLAAPLPGRAVERQS